MRIVFFCMAAALLLSCGSCSRNHEPIYPVSGKVTYMGKPASGAVVYFHRKDSDPHKEPTMMGVVQDDGSFEIECGGFGKGAPAGDYDVTIQWQRVTGPGIRRPQTRPDVLEGRYADPQKPLLHAKVEPGTNALPTFALTK